jgi:PmbA protein
MAVPFGEKRLGTLVIAPQCLSDFIDFAIGAFMSQSSVIAGTSRWRNSIGEHVGDEGFSLSSLPGDRRMVAACGFTSDGFSAAAQEVILNGRLISLLPDLYTANKTGLKRAKSYGGAWALANGAQSLEELIGSVETGLLMYRFSGGTPQASGDFSGVAKNSFIIREGHITDAAKETTVSGNLADMFMNLRGLSSTLICDGSSVMPYAAFGGITIS